MPPKREHKKDNDSLTGVVVVDSYDPRFAPFSETGKPWCLFPICSVPAINFTLSWIARTEVQKLLLVVSEKNVHAIEKLERNWNHCFESISIVSCKNAMNVGDALRELDTRGLLTGDFLLVSDPATVTSSTLQTQIAAFRERRAENKNNVMTLIYSDLKTPNNAVIAVESVTKKLKAYHRQEDPRKLDIDKSYFIGDAVIRQDILDSGIALCSLNISTQFSDNFDFQHRDDVIREILVNEEILLQNIHVERLQLLAASLSNLVMERWFHPLVLDRMVCLDSIHKRCLQSSQFLHYLSSLSFLRNLPVFNALPGQRMYCSTCNETLRKLNTHSKGLTYATFVSNHVFNVTLGCDCDIDDSVALQCASIGNGTKIGTFD
ncbi:hypothetical protein COOONC_20735 [Cooperia oncophora]